MQWPCRMRQPVQFAAVLLATTMLAVAAPLFAQEAVDGDKSQARSIVQDQCTFSDGSTISFGRRASGANESGGSVWQSGKYYATNFQVTGQMVVPPLDHPVKIPPGSYTLFVDTTKGVPWTLIISRITGKAGMPYPGDQYDVGRQEMGSDVSSSPVNRFVIGCTQFGIGPIVVWMEHGSLIAYAKIMVERTQNGQTEYLIH
jgi:hypothetical protein